MFNKFNQKDDPLLDSVKGVIDTNQIHRQARTAFNEALGIQDRKELPHELLYDYDQELAAFTSKTLTEGVMALDELSKSVLKSYSKKAKKSSDDLRDTVDFNDPKNKKLGTKLDNRDEGRAKASARLRGKIGVSKYKLKEEEAIHPNQQKLDVHEPDKDKLTKDDFDKLRSSKNMADTQKTFPNVKHDIKEEEALEEGKDAQGNDTFYAPSLKSKKDRLSRMIANKLGKKASKMNAKNKDAPKGLVRMAEDRLDELSIQKMEKHRAAARKANADPKNPKGIKHMVYGSDVVDKKIKSRTGTYLPSKARKLLDKVVDKMHSYKLEEDIDTVLEEIAANLHAQYTDICEIGGDAQAFLDGLTEEQYDILNAIVEQTPFRVVTAADMKARQAQDRGRLAGVIAAGKEGVTSRKGLEFASQASAAAAGGSSVTKVKGFAKGGDVDVTKFSGKTPAYLQAARDAASAVTSKTPLAQNKVPTTTEKQPSGKVMPGAAEIVPQGEFKRGPVAPSAVSASASNNPGAGAGAVSSAKPGYNAMINRGTSGSKPNPFTMEEETTFTPRPTPMDLMRAIKRDTE